MLKKSLITLSILLAAVAVQAQPSPAKKDLVAKILKLQQPGIEAMARGLVEQPAAELLNNAAAALPARVAKDKQESVAKEIKGDVQKYLDEAVPVVQTRAIKLAPTTIGALLEEKLTEEELKQVVSIMESPVYAKYQRMGDDMQKVLVEKLLAETRGTIEPKVRTLEQTVAKRLGVTSAPEGSGAGGGTAPRAPAKPAAK
ncbi:hypothetical protein [Caenimonas soli]|uniref:hypothetical protein n=1 Tax=Caenimonas soli TaxID=2735555 RepID=UPI001553BAB6|nr:hypothetical protein [Caenimonas soli]NPC54070.1 hypothetical protein [Caenimonas soli]